MVNDNGTQSGFIFQPKKWWNCWLHVRWW
jgi:hypothetical protein